MKLFNGVNHPASFGSSKYAVIIVIFSLLGSHCKDNHQIQKDSSLESFFQILSLFSQPGFLEKGAGLQNLNWSRDITGRVNIIRSLFFPGSSAQENRFWISKSFLGKISLCNW